MANQGAPKGRRSPTATLAGVLFGFRPRLFTLSRFWGLFVGCSTGNIWWRIGFGTDHGVIGLGSRVAGPFRIPGCSRPPPPPQVASGTQPEDQREGDPRRACLRRSSGPRGSFRGLIPGCSPSRAFGSLRLCGRRARPTPYEEAGRRLTGLDDQSFPAQTVEGLDAVTAW